MALSLEERVAHIEEELKRLRDQRTPLSAPAEGWQRLVGSFDDDPDFAEILRQGKAFRDSQQPDYDSASPSS